MFAAESVTIAWEMSKIGPKNAYFVRRLSRTDICVDIIKYARRRLKSEEKKDGRRKVT